MLSWFCRAPKRQALYAVYAFMRRCDDIADDTSLTAHERRLKLGAWVEAFHQSQAGKPTDDPVQLALADAVRRFQIPAVLLDQLAYGTAMDIEERSGEGGMLLQHLPTRPVQLADENGSRRRSSNTRPLMICICIATGWLRSWGWCASASSAIATPAAEALAERCGLAFQLTNIIRDVKEDAAMDRVYIPQEDLTRFDIAPSELRAGKDLDRIRPLLAREADRAREFYRAARRTDSAHQRRQPAGAVGAGHHLSASAGEDCAARLRRVQRENSADHAREADDFGKGLSEASGVMTAPWTQAPNVAVVGGGLAGLASACALAEQRFSRHSV